ncbi:alpha-tectorin-like [Alosa alosa]|uniref:alpha-tectorin-like n=1 Tax=Alosa alosa TaxID=278164 RepID=UPI0020155009|nr:alpha-tectorin-like [Alosa alosa]
MAQRMDAFEEKMDELLMLLRSYQSPPSAPVDDLLLLSCSTIGESVINEDCSESYTCLGSSVVKQESIRCKSDEVCKVMNGIKSCYLQQCSITASGGVSLFDGTRGSIDTEGTYELVKLCSDSLVADFFRVLVVFQTCKGRGQNCITMVYVFFNKYVITVTSQQETWVNGIHVSLPRSLKNEIDIHVAGDSVVIEKKSVLHVSYNFSHDVTITVGEAVASHVCGACGRLNANGELMLKSHSSEDLINSMAEEE